MTDEKRKAPFCNIDHECRYRDTIMDNKDEIRKKAPLWIILVLIGAWLTFASYATVELNAIARSVTTVESYQKIVLDKLGLHP